MLNIVRCRTNGGERGLAVRAGLRSAALSHHRRHHQHTITPNCASPLLASHHQPFSTQSSSISSHDINVPVLVDVGAPRLLGSPPSSTIKKYANNSSFSVLRTFASSTLFHSRACVRPVQNRSEDPNAPIDQQHQPEWEPITDNNPIQQSNDDTTDTNEDDNDEQSTNAIDPNSEPNLVKDKCIYTLNFIVSRLRYKEFTDEQRELVPKLLHAAYTFNYKLACEILLKLGQQARPIPELLKEYQEHRRRYLQENQLQQSGSNRSHVRVPRLDVFYIKNNLFQTTLRSTYRGDTTELQRLSEAAKHDINSLINMLFIPSDREQRVKLALDVYELSLKLGDFDKMVAMNVVRSCLANNSPEGLLRVLELNTKYLHGCLRNPFTNKRIDDEFVLRRFSIMLAQGMKAHVEANTKRAGGSHSAFNQSISAVHGTVDVRTIDHALRAQVFRCVLRAHELIRKRFGLGFLTSSDRYWNIIINASCEFNQPELGLKLIREQEAALALAATVNTTDADDDKAKNPNDTTVFDNIKLKVYAMLGMTDQIYSLVDRLAERGALDYYSLTAIMKGFSSDKAKLDEVLATIKAKQHGVLRGILDKINPSLSIVRPQQNNQQKIATEETVETNAATPATVIDNNTNTTAATSDEANYFSIDDRSAEAIAKGVNEASYAAHIHNTLAGDNLQSAWEYYTMLVKKNLIRHDSSIHNTILRALIKHLNKGTYTMNDSNNSNNTKNNKRNDIDAMRARFSYIAPHFKFVFGAASSLNPHSLLHVFNTVCCILSDHRLGKALLSRLETHAHKYDLFNTEVPFHFKDDPEYGWMLTAGTGTGIPTVTGGRVDSDTIRVPPLSAESGTRLRTVMPMLYSSVMLACADHRDLGLISIFRAMQDNGFEPDTLVYNTLLRLLFLHIANPEVSQLIIPTIRAMRQHAFLPLFQTLYALFDLVSKDTNPREPIISEIVHELALFEDIGVQYNLIVGYLKYLAELSAKLPGSPRNALTTLHKLKELNLPIRERTFANALRAVANSKECDKDVSSPETLEEVSSIVQQIWDMMQEEEAKCIAAAAASPTASYVPPRVHRNTYGDHYYTPEDDLTNLASRLGFRECSYINTSRNDDTSEGEIMMSINDSDNENTKSTSDRSNSFFYTTSGEQYDVEPHNFRVSQYLLNLVMRCYLRMGDLASVHRAYQAAQTAVDIPPSKEIPAEEHVLMTKLSRERIMLNMYADLGDAEQMDLVLQRINEVVQQISALPTPQHTRGLIYNHAMLDMLLKGYGKAGMTSRVTKVFDDYLHKFEDAQEQGSCYHLLIRNLGDNDDYATLKKYWHKLKTEPFRVEQQPATRSSNNRPLIPILNEESIRMRLEAMDGSNTIPSPKRQDKAKLMQNTHRGGLAKVILDAFLEEFVRLNQLGDAYEVFSYAKHEQVPLDLELLQNFADACAAAATPSQRQMQQSPQAATPTPTTTTTDTTTTANKKHEDTNIDPARWLQEIKLAVKGQSDTASPLPPPPKEAPQQQQKATPKPTAAETTKHQNNSNSNKLQPNAPTTTTNASKTTTAATTAPTNANNAPKKQQKKKSAAVSSFKQLSLMRSFDASIAASATQQQRQ